VRNLPYFRRAFLRLTHCGPDGPLIKYPPVPRHFTWLNVQLLNIFLLTVEFIDGTPEPSAEETALWSGTTWNLALYLVSHHFLCTAHTLHRPTGYFFLPSLPATILSILFMLKSHRESAWMVLFRPPGIVCLSGHWNLSPGLGWILEFWYPGPCYLVQEVLCTYKWPSPESKFCIRTNIFAVGTNIIISSSYFKDFCSVLNFMLCHMSKWFAANNLVLNLDKMNIIEFIIQNPSHSTLHIGYKEKYVEETMFKKFLSLQIVNHINWKHHI